MRIHVEFRSDAFPAEPGEEEKINPGRWGAALARYLRQELSAQGLHVHEPYAEDRGYGVEIENAAFNLWIGCGNYEEYPNGFLCFIMPDKPFVWKRFRRIDTRARVDEIAETLESVLRKHPGVQDLRWWPDSRRARGGRQQS
jgi:hypothetical protein